MLLVATILSSLLVHGIAQEDFPDFCLNRTLVMKYVLASQLQPNFIYSPELRCLSIPYSDVANMTVGAFDGVPNLVYLNLEGNRIPPEAMFSFGNVSNIRQLILRDQYARFNYSEIHVHEVYPTLEYLDLSNRHKSGTIKQIWSEKKYPFPNLKYLDISGNRFDRFIPFEKWDDTLIRLNANNNRLSNVYLKQSSNLVELLLDGNELYSIGSNYDLDLSGLDSLEYLSVIENKLNFISKEAFNGTLNLRYLDFSMNNLSTLHPETFTNLTSLDTVILDYNHFDIVPIKESLNVTILSMICNNLTYLSVNSLQNLTQLKRLSLGGNRIQLIDSDTFKSQEWLEELHLNDNKLKYLPEYWFQYLKNLRYLDLSGNGITSIEYMFNTDNFPLERLYLEEPLQLETPFSNAQIV
ncbi:uncharacterized protein LOC105663802 isoform X3 [Megachile rotundata]|uniref:uncharacterized protein LOC105663802 isoform X3 n=1 Tax=Megachile rotundata TaxID=143995 RepID=UPI003FD5F049